MAAPIPKRGSGENEWNDGHYVQIYSLALRGETEASIARWLGVSKSSLDKWKREKPYVKEAIRLARNRRGTSGAIMEHVFGRLPEDLQELWKRICECDKVDGGYAKLQELLNKGGKINKQRLFLHALVTNHFNRSKACQIIGISPWELKKWVQDEDFLRLIREVEEVKKDFVEGALMQGIAEGDVNLIKFANSTLNKDRGYGYTVKTEGTVNHVHSMLEAEDFLAELDEATATKVVEAMERVVEKRKLLSGKEVIDVKAEVRMLGVKDDGEESA